MFFVFKMRELRLSILGGPTKSEVSGVFKLLWNKWNMKKGRNHGYVYIAEKL